MKKIFTVALGIFMIAATAHAQNFFLETSMPKTGALNAGARFTVFNNINDIVAIGLMGRIHRFSYANNGVSSGDPAVVNLFESSVGGGFKFNFVSQRSFQAYVSPMLELTTFRRDAGANLAGSLGISKELAWPFVFNLEVTARHRTLMYTDPLAVNNRLTMFISAGFGLALLEAYQGPGPVLLNKTKPRRRKPVRY
jgi:hypothetical protein